MMISKNKKKAKAASRYEACSRIKCIVAAFIKWQRDVAKRMQLNAEKRTTRGKHVMLLLFCVLSVAYSICLLSGESFHSFSITPVTIPLYAGETGELQSKSSPIISEKEYQRIREFEVYMDSIARSPAGKKLYDSISVARAGLMDSIFLISKIYRSQHKK